MPYSNIIWIKLEKRLLNDYRHYSLPEDAQLIYFKILLVAAETYNKIPKEPEILKSILRSSSTPSRIKECLDLIKGNYPKFKENAHNYFFSEWSNRHNWVEPKETLGSSFGVPKDVPDIDKNRLDKEEEKNINMLIEIFKPLNPLSYRKWYSNKTQRGAVYRLHKQLGRENLELAINTAVAAQTMPYAPVITSPLQLEDKLVSLKSFVEKSKIGSKIISV